MQLDQVSVNSGKRFNLNSPMPFAELALVLVLLVVVVSSGVS
jgi:hypothetical protein